MLTLIYKDKKHERTCRWLLRRFSSPKQLIVPTTVEEHLALTEERRLGMTYWDGLRRQYFPTVKGWEYFSKFVRQIHIAEPFRSRASLSDTHRALNQAFSTSISKGLLPEEVAELLDHLPREFVDAVTGRSERTASKLNGIDYDELAFFRLGHCWIGRFDSIDFDCLSTERQESERGWIQALSKVFDPDTPIILSDRILGTRDYVKQEADFQCELALSILSVMINVTYESVFSRLWQIRRMDRPEYGFSKHFSFSLIRKTADSDAPNLGISTRSLDQWFKIDSAVLDRWHHDYGLDLANDLAANPLPAQSDIQARWINAVLYFRQAANQRIPEMQMATLWICVESFFTAGHDDVLDGILPGLLAVTAMMPVNFWPKGSKSLAELRRVFKKYYQFRSRTFHHGRRGHVTPADVQAFSYVVCNLIVAMTHWIAGGLDSAEQLLRRSRVMLDRENRSPDTSQDSASRGDG